MRVAIIGSRNLQVDITQFIPEGTTALISGGASGVDNCVKKYAQQSGIEYIEYLPDYTLFKAMAPLIRNDQIIDMADLVVAIWDGYSRGTKYVVERCKEQKKPIRVYIKKK